MVKCKNGTRKVKGNCVPYIKLNSEDLDDIIRRLKLKPSSKAFLKTIKFSKRSIGFYKYNKDRSDDHNLYNKVTGTVEGILKNGSAAQINKLR